MTTTVYKTDWLASRPVFYNEQTLQVSHCINDVIDWAHLTFHPEGLYHYLRFGYSVFGQTPLMHVKFLPPCTELAVVNGRISLVQHPDEALSALSQCVYTEQTLIELLRNEIDRWERTADTIVIPTSGGYDSRLLNALVNDKSKIHAFSYGASVNHPEAQKARLLCEKLHIDWQYVGLGQFHRYLDDWDALFGISTHAHGMYQMEFYHQIAQLGLEGSTVLSGIVGDLWAGSIEVPPIRSAADLDLLGYTHNLTADCSQLLLKHDNELAETYYATHRDLLEDPRGRILQTIRMKMMLLRYLMEVPRALGFRPCSPFLHLEPALGMLNLPPERRKHRRWQQELFAWMGLDLERMPVHGSRKGHIVLNGMRQMPLKPLRTDLFRELIRPAYIDWINQTLANSSRISYWYDDWMFTPYLKEILRKLGCRHRRIEAYFAYLTLKPIENLLIKRETLSRNP